MAKLKEFVVQITNIADEDGNKCKPGSKIMLSRPSAEHYHKLGYIAIPLGDVFGDDDAEDKGKATSASSEDTQEDADGPATNRPRRKPSSGATQAALNEAKGRRNN